jgi:hypothetical protein
VCISAAGARHAGAAVPIGGEGRCRITDLLKTTPIVPIVGDVGRQGRSKYAMEADHARSMAPVPRSAELLFGCCLERGQGAFGGLVMSVAHLAINRATRYCDKRCHAGCHAIGAIDASCRFLHRRIVRFSRRSCERLRKTHPFQPML